MAKLRMRFIKEDQAAWISHLDLMRTFQRCFLRAGLVVRHSQGFHPHPLMSILLPLPVGQSSECELMDFETVGEVDIPALIESMNEGMPLGIRVLECYEVTRPVRELKTLQARVEFEYDNGIPADAADRILSLFKEAEVIVEKKGKNGPTEQNIAPMILELSAEECNSQELKLNALICCQNPSLNPAQITAAIAKYIPELTPDFVRICRREIYNTNKEIFR